MTIHVRRLRCFGHLTGRSVQVLVFFLYAGFPVAAPAVLADVIDYGKLRFGVDYAGTSFAIYNVMYKAVPGFGTAIAIAIVEFGGFDARPATQSPSGTIALVATFCGLPALLLAIVAPLLWYFPIDARRQRIIVERLKRRAARAHAAAMMSLPVRERRGTAYVTGPSRPVRFCAGGAR